MTDYPRFFSKNYVLPVIVDFEKNYDNIVVSTGNATKKFLLDRVRSTQWISSSPGGLVKEKDWQIDNFDDDPIAWVSADAEVTVTRDASIKHEGTASVKVAITSAWAGGLIAYHNLPATLDMTRDTGLKWWYRANITSGLSNLFFVLSESLNCATIDKVFAFPSDESTLTWHEVIKTGAISLDEVKSIGLRDVSGTLDGRNIWVDDLRTTRDPEIVEVQFYEGSVALDRTINAIALQNINLKEFKLQYENTGGEWADVIGASWTDNSATSLLQEFSDITTGRMRLVIESTQTANQEKKIGELFLIENLYDLTDAMDTYRPTRISKWGDFRLANFENAEWWIKEKYKATVGLRRISLTELNALKAVYDLHEEFVWIPEPESRPDEIYLVTWKPPWSEPYSSLYKGLGYNVTLNLEEV